jgi:hypothetical protein
MHRRLIHNHGADRRVPIVNPACERTTESVPMFGQLSTKIGANGEPF